MPKATKDGKDKKERGWYAQIGLSQENYKNLLKIKAAREKDVGIPLSWNHFFALVVRDFEEAKK